MQSKKSRNILLWILLIFVFPIGLIVLWMGYKDYPKKNKIIYSTVIGLIYMIAIVDDTSNKKENEINSINTQQTILLENDTIDKTEITLDNETIEIISDESFDKNNEISVTSKDTLIEDYIPIEDQLDALQKLYLEINYGMTLGDIRPMIENSGIPYYLGRYKAMYVVFLAVDAGEVITIDTLKEENKEYDRLFIYLNRDGYSDDEKRINSVEYINYKYDISLYHSQPYSLPDPDGRMNTGFVNKYSNKKLYFNSKIEQFENFLRSSRKKLLMDVAKVKQLTGGDLLALSFFS